MYRYDFKFIKLKIDIMNSHTQEPTDPVYESDIELIKLYFYDVFNKNLDKYSNLKIEKIEVPVPFMNIRIEGTEYITEYGISANHYSDDIVSMLELIDEYSWSIFVQRYYEGKLNIEYNKQITNAGCKLYKISVNEAGKPLYAVSDIYDESHPYYHSIHLIIPDNTTTDNLEQIYQYIN